MWKICERMQFLRVSLNWPSIRRLPCCHSLADPGPTEIESEQMNIICDQLCVKLQGLFSAVACDFFVALPGRMRLPATGLA